MPRLCLPALLLGFSIFALPAMLRGEEQAAFTKHANLAYAEHEGVEANLTSLDVYAPAGAKDLPVMVYIHGGGWRQGDKANVEGKPRLFCGLGYVFVSINYRLTPAVKHPTHIEDVAAAFAHIVKNIAKYGGDSRKLVVIGHSAGAHLAGLIAADHRRWEKEGIDPAALRGAVLLDGALYHAPRRAEAVEKEKPFFLATFGPSEEQLLDASPIHHVRTGNAYPRMLIVHAGDRELSRVQGAMLAEAFQAAGGYAEMLHAPEKDHGGVNRDIGRPNDAMSERILAFIAECFAEKTKE